MSKVFDKRNKAHPTTIVLDLCPKCGENGLILKDWADEREAHCLKCGAWGFKNLGPGGWVWK